MKKLFLGVTLMGAAFFTACSNKSAQQADAETAATAVTENAPEFIRLNAGLVVDAANAPKAIELAKQLISASLKDAGVMDYDMYQSETRPGWFMIYETWKDQPSLEAHSASAHFTTLVPQMQKLGPLSIDQFLQVPNPETAGKNIRINCMLVLKDGASKEQLVEKAKELVAASLKDSGVIEYDILTSVTRPNQLMIFETWKDQPSLDAHSASAHFTTLVPQIQQMTSNMDIQLFYK